MDSEETQTDMAHENVAQERETQPLEVDQALFQDSEKRADDLVKHEDSPLNVEELISKTTLIPMMVAITSAIFLMLLDTSIIATAIPYITNDFHSLSDVGWYGSSYQIASASLQLLTGKIYVNFNSKWTFLVFFAIFELGSLLCGVATSSKMLIVGRAVAGMGCSGIQNGGFSIVAACVPMTRRPALIGIAMGFSQLGLVLGPLIGGALTEYVSWRWCFYINLPVGALVFASLFFVRVPEPRKNSITSIRLLPRDLDLIGFALFAPAAIQLLLALQYGGNQFAWNSSTVIGLFCGAGATCIVFLVWEYYKGDEAMIPFSMARNRIISSSSVAFGLMMALTFTASYYLPLYFQGVNGASPTLSGVYLLPSILSQTFSVGLSGALVAKVGYYTPFMLGGSALAAVANGLLATLAPGTSTGKWIGYQILLGVGRGLCMQMPILSVQNLLAPAQIPIAMGLVVFSSSFGGSLFLSFADTILTNSLLSLIPQYAPYVDAQAVAYAGATGLRDVVSAQDLPGVLIAYSKSIDRNFYLCAAASAACFVCAWGMGWKRIGGAKKQDEKV
ncbi:MFS multidrug transporter [Lipomyces kononenkoae]|uniref:MFS multidrug transporter n=1 Tax=Lipomyces kononenkoae TaxID=34357 RepID=A0ACC3SVS9_LIPKO